MRSAMAMMVMMLTTWLLCAQEPLYEKHPSLQQTLLATRARLQQWQASQEDANAPNYGSYFGRRNIAYRDRPDFRPVPTLESALGIPPATQ